MTTDNEDDHALSVWFTAVPHGSVAATDTDRPLARPCRVGNDREFGASAGYAVKVLGSALTALDLQGNDFSTAFAGIDETEFALIPWHTARGNRGIGDTALVP